MSLSYKAASVHCENKEFVHFENKEFVHFQNKFFKSQNGPTILI